MSTRGHVFEMHAKAGARVEDLVAQARGVAGGPGHIFVFIYAMGNDLLTGNFNFPALSAGFGNAFDYFTDESRFPDGATFLLNTQYTPNDECDVPGKSVAVPPSLVLSIQAANQQIFAELAKTRTDATAIDQYPQFLGHGTNANISGCPHCGADNSSWIADGLHPNPVGNARIAEKWFAAVDRMVDAGCSGPR